MATERYIIMRSARAKAGDDRHMLCVICGVSHGIYYLADNPERHREAVDADPPTRPLRDLILVVRETRGGGRRVRQEPVAYERWIDEPGPDSEEARFLLLDGTEAVADVDEIGT